MESQAEIFNKIVERRKSYRVFDLENPIPDDVVKRSLERAILSPNSSNMQLWEFYIVKKEEDKKEMTKICMNQSGAKTASQMIVFVSRPDKWKNRQQILVGNLDKAFESRESPGAKGAYMYYEQLIPLLYNPSIPIIRDLFKKGLVFVKSRKESFMREVFSKHIPVITQKSTALAAQTFMLSVVSEGYDTLPMEGYDSVRLKKFLKLPKDVLINMVVAVGKGDEKGLYAPRFRIPYDDVVFDV